MNKRLTFHIGLVHLSLLGISLLVHILFINDNFLNRWGTFLAFSIVSFIFLNYLQFTRANLHDIKSSLFLLSLQSLIIYMNILFLFFKRTLSFKLSGLGTEYIIVTGLVSIGLVLIGLEGRRPNNLKEIIQILVNPFFQLSIFIWTTLSFTRLVEYQVKYFSASNIRYIILYIGLFMLIHSFLNNSRQLNRKLFIISFYLLLILAFVFAFRSDSINQIGSSGFHLGYYSGVISTIKSGGTLLFDTPSQYGFLNILIPSLFTYESSRESFYIFQSILFVIFFYVISVILYKYYNKTLSIFLFFVIFLAIYFADPELIGPQLYPSSSLSRFLPSLLMVIWFYYLERDSKNSLGFGIIVIETLLLLFSALWSAESLLYSASILFFVFIYRLLTTSFDSLIRFYGLIIILLSISLILLVLIFRFTTGHVPDISLYFMYSLKYAQGFGSNPLSISSPIWIFPIVILFIFLLKNLDSNHNAIFKYASVGALLGWFTYFIGRSVPDNVVALTPQVVVLIILNYLLIRDLKLKKLAILPIAIYSFILAASIVMNPSLISKITTIKLYSTTIVDPSDTNLELQTIYEELSDEFKQLPIVYSGYSGLMPTIEGKSTENHEKTWLPVPSGLLQEPISSDKQRQILNRFILNTNFSSGILLLDKQNSFPERFLTLKEIISSFYTCSVIIETEQWLFEKCDKKI